MKETKLGPEAAVSVLEASGTNLSVALVMARSGVSREEADRALRRSNGRVEEAIRLLSDRH
jgi:NACalpha-BTF3-like transcription factor